MQFEMIATNLIEGNIKWAFFQRQYLQDFQTAYQSAPIGESQ